MTTIMTRDGNAFLVYGSQERHGLKVNYIARIKLKTYIQCFNSVLSYVIY